MRRVPRQIVKAVQFPNAASRRRMVVGACCRPGATIGADGLRFVATGTNHISAHQAANCAQSDCSGGSAEKSGVLCERLRRVQRLLPRRGSGPAGRAAAGFGSGATIARGGA